MNIFSSSFRAQREISHRAYDKVKRSLTAFGMTFTLLVSFLILNFTFLIPTALAAENPGQEIVEIGNFCFRKQECVTYDALQSPFPDPACSIPGPGHNAAAVNYQYIYNCYANAPQVDLQVSIGGYKVQGIENYIQRLYIALVSIAGLVAGIMYVWAGVKWLTSAGAPDRITDAKKKIGNASLGLVLVLSSYVILNTVNPALVSLKLPNVKIVRRDLTETNDWCVKRSEFGCGGISYIQQGGQWIADPALPAKPNGQWDCSDPKYVDTNPPCGEPKGGKCYGQWCPGGTGGCSLYDQNKIVHSIVSTVTDAATIGGSISDDLLVQAVAQKFGGAICISESEKNACSELFTAGDYNNQTIPEGVAKCISNSSNCILKVGFSATGAWSLECTTKKADGQHCNADQECLSNICTFIGVNKCALAKGNPDATPCSRNIECESGRCAYTSAWAGIAAGMTTVTKRCIGP